MFRARILSAFVTAVLVMTAVAAHAHDIPNDVTIQAFLKPEGQRLRLLVRVPLESMRDMPVPAHPDGSLDVGRLQPLLADNAMLWIAHSVDIFENETALPVARIVDARASLPSDRSFTSYESALAHVTGPALPGNATLYWTAGLVDALFEYPIQSDRSDFSIRPKLARLGVRTLTVLRFVTPDGAVRPFEYFGDPGLVRLDPRWYQAAGRFVELGFFHILDGTDHLLFLFCLVIPFRRLRRLIPVVTAFTVAHSITLIASAYDFAPDALWFPPLIETLIAMSIVYMALENIVLAEERSSALQRRWMITFAFGLVHGFGFSFALRQTMQFAGTHLLTSLLSFNIGVELGQLLVLVLMIPALDLAFRYLVAERIGTVILSALVAHTGWHWMIDRWGALRQYRFEWPAVNALFLLDVARWLFAVVLLAAIVWFVRGRRQMKTTTAFHWMLCLVLLASPAFAQGRGNAQTPMQAPADAKPFSPTLEDVPYPYPVQTMKLTMYGHDVRMAYMDVPAAGQANGRAVVLLHGMNFYGEAWSSTIEVLRREGFRVVVPDQIGFGRSTKAVMPYTLSDMAFNTHKLLETVGLQKAAIVGHSMGGMVAARFALLYPDATERLVLYNQIGLTDARLQRPPTPLDDVYKGLLNQGYNAVYQGIARYFVNGIPKEAEKYITRQYGWTLSGNWPEAAMVRALVQQMVYEDPVVYDWAHIKVAKVLEIGGDKDGPNFPELAKHVADTIPGCQLVLIPNVGHVPHFEAPEPFFRELLKFLKS